MVSVYSIDKELNVILKNYFNLNNDM